MSKSVARALSILLLLVTIPVGANAQTRINRPPEITLIYDLEQRAFVCWLDGTSVKQESKSAQTDMQAARTATIPGCPQSDGRPFLDNLHFYTGQRIAIRVVGASIADSFSVDVKADGITVPGIPVFGADIELPSLLTLVPDPLVKLGPGIQLATAPLSLNIGAILLQKLDTVEVKDYDESLLAITDAPTDEKLVALLGGSGSEAIRRLNLVLESGNGFRTSIASIKAAASGLSSAERIGLRTRYCQPSAEAPLPNDADVLLAFVQETRKLQERHLAAVALATAIGLDERAGVLAAWVGVAIAPQTQELLRLDSGSIRTFIAEFNKLLAADDAIRLVAADDPIRTIATLKIVKSKYLTDGNQEPDLLLRLNMLQTKPTADTLEQLKKNLLLLLYKRQALLDAAVRLDLLRTKVTQLTTYASSPSEYSAVVDTLTDIAIQSAAMAEAVNCVARAIPLPEHLSVAHTDIWYDAKQITVTLKRQTRMAQLALTGKASPAAAAPVKPETPGDDTKKPATAGAAADDKAAEKKAAEAKAAEAKTASPASAETLGIATFRVRNRYQFQIGMGFMISRGRDNARDARYQLVKETKTVAGVESVEQYFVQTRDRRVKFLPTVDIIYYPRGRDFFPSSPRYEGEPGPKSRMKFGVLAGFSPTDPTRDFFFGGTYINDSGAGFKAGVHLAFVDKLPDGVTLEEPVIRKATIVDRKAEWRGFVGLAFNVGLFRDLFAAVLKR